MYLIVGSQYFLCLGVFLEGLIFLAHFEVDVAELVMLVCDRQLVVS